MRSTSWSKWRSVLGAASIAALLILPAGAGAIEFIGLDTNDDGDCDTGGDFDMGRYYTAGEVDVAQSFDVFVDGVPNFFGYGCCFCVRDSTHLSQTYSWTFHSPSGWSDTPFTSQNDPGFGVILSPYITDQPGWKYKCFFAQSYDFTFTNPVTTLPYIIGTFTFQAASEGPISWAFDLDPLSTGFQSTGFSTFNFADPGEACPSPAASQATTWGSVKSLFR